MEPTYSGVVLEEVMTLPGQMPGSRKPRGATLVLSTRRNRAPALLNEQLRICSLSCVAAEHVCGSQAASLLLLSCLVNVNSERSPVLLKNPRGCIGPFLVLSPIIVAAEFA